MSHDLFEDRLRTELRGATEAEAPAFLDIDPAAVLGTGRRIVRRRRMAAVGGTLAAVTVLGVGSWAVLDGSSDRALQEVPAGPSATMTTGTATADLETSTLEADGNGTSTLPGERIRVTIDRATGVLKWSTLRDGTPRLIEEGRVPSVQRGVVWRSLSSMKLLLGVVPGDAEQFQLVTPTYDEGGHASTTATEALPGTGLKAIAVSFAEVGDAEAVSHVLWWDGGLSVQDEDGSTVPSVALGDPDGTVVYVSEELDRMGTFSDSDGTTMMEIDGSRNSSGRPVLSTGRGDGDTVSWLFAAVVPADAEPGTLTPGQGATVTTPLTKVPVPGTDLAVLWSRQSSPKDAKGSGYASVTWTEDGRTVTQTP
ncbi:hypothetical protein G7075_01980 [Phycicoccus sp. HDW14]|uniref:hypothetical protein n=1 Tax=Phycicoccus sp. HDW14 TaxID=2714941 RepID=UPI00140D0280|nr:hypothetical protein [Phycicoccus sp. HDW14]QIM20203.1 hypothetical protein G7075_01980 [Phycicoccus sp. HDW14]